MRASSTPQVRSWPPGQLSNSLKRPFFATVACLLALPEELRVAHDRLGWVMRSPVSHVGAATPPISIAVLCGVARAVRMRTTP